MIPRLGKLALAATGAWAAFGMTGDILSGNVIRESAAASIPTVDERVFMDEEVDGAIHSGVEFTVINPQDSFGEIFSWIAFMDGDRFAEATNFWGYQTVTSVEEWNADMTSEGFNPGAIENPLSWAELFAPVGAQAESFLQQGLVGIGFFLPIFESNPSFRDFVLGGADFSLGGTGILPGESLDGFFALNIPLIGSPMAFAHLPGNPDEAPIITANAEFSEIPAPATALLLGVGLAGLGFARRRREAASVPERA